MSGGDDETVKGHTERILASTELNHLYNMYGYFDTALPIE